MTEDFYLAAQSAVRHHLDEAGASYTVDDGEFLIGGHRLGLSITFEGFVSQGAHTLAPLDVQIHVDGDSGDRFRVGTLGVGKDRDSARQEAISEWHLLALSPVLAALGASINIRRTQTQPQRLAGWDLFAGRVGIRGKVPPELRLGSPFYQSLLEKLRGIVSNWEQPNRFELRSLFFMATCGPDGSEIQAAVDGIVNEELAGSLGSLAWPAGDETYLYKQLYVLRSQPDS